jgi:hypothetical protein
MVSVDLTDAQIYYLGEIMLHEWYRIKESPNRDILEPFLDRMSEALPRTEGYPNWKTFLEVVQQENERAADIANPDRTQL